MKKYKNIFFILIFILCIGGCGSDDVTDQITNIVQAEDPNVLGVKNGTNNAYPNKTYGDAFESFFAYPTWKYFEGTRNGPDDDGDGKPDYVEEGLDIVEFTGYCTYQDVEVKALIQFVLHDDGTFEAAYLSFNDVPQNNFMLWALLEKAFTDGEDASEVEQQENSITSDEMPEYKMDDENGKEDSAIIAETEVVRVDENQVSDADVVANDYPITDSERLINPYVYYAYSAYDVVQALMLDYGESFIEIEYGGYMTEDAALFVYDDTNSRVAIQIFESYDRTYSWSGVHCGMTLEQALSIIEPEIVGYGDTYDGYVEYALVGDIYIGFYYTDVITDITIHCPMW